MPNHKDALVHYSIELAKSHIEAGEVAWFAPRGVPMVAMTPERVDALRHMLNDEADFFEVDSGNHAETDHCREVLREMLH